jgi:hypothetical protein
MSLANKNSMGRNPVVAFFRQGINSKERQSAQKCYAGSNLRQGLIFYEYWIDFQKLPSSTFSAWCRTWPWKASVRGNARESGGDIRSYQIGLIRVVSSFEASTKRRINYHRENVKGCTICFVGFIDRGKSAAQNTIKRAKWIAQQITAAMI